MYNNVKYLMLYLADNQNLHFNKYKVEGDITLLIFYYSPNSNKLVLRCQETLTFNQLTRPHNVSVWVINSNLKTCRKEPEVNKCV